MTTRADYYLDITKDVCPMTFVKTKLQIERMAPGEILEVRLNEGEPLENVPRSIADEGHELLSLEAEAEQGTGRAVHVLRMRKA